jgi:maltoporin
MRTEDKLLILANHIKISAAISRFGVSAVKYKNEVYHLRGGDHVEVVQDIIDGNNIKDKDIETAENNMEFGYLNLDTKEFTSFDQIDKINKGKRKKQIK